MEKNIHGKDHLSVATSYNNIGGVLHAQGKYAEALWYYFKALAIYEQVYGNDHPDVAASYNNIGMVLQDQGNYPEALVYLKKALGVLKKMLGSKHPSTLTCMRNIKLVKQKISTQEKAKWEVSWVHPHIGVFINIAATNTVQDLLEMAGIDNSEVKIVTVDTSKIGEMHLSLNFSSSTAFKKFVKYYREKYNNFFLPYTQWEYNPGQPVEIFIDTKVLQDVMPELDRYRNRIFQEEKHY
jgi:tetratricopeptide (TPR) repeat protein